MLGLSFDDVKELALSIETIHSYSLVHDDLPAMDNDDYRRGKLSTHKKFGEANGILAGDALLNFAFEHSLSKENLTVNHAKALLEIGKCSGYLGMVGGQVLDLQNENNPKDDLDVLFDIVENKTAKLLIAPLVASSIIADRKYYDELFEFGYNLGFLFQITDDILDVEGTLESIGKTPNKDAESNKLTFVKYFGLDGAKAQAKERYEKCLQILSKIDNSEFLIEFTHKIYLRKN
jgi:geranylgeranyl diphosphate synthase type II